MHFVSSAQKGRKQSCVKVSKIILTLRSELASERVKRGRDGHHVGCTPSGSLARGRSSIGRPRALQAGGRQFD